MNKVNERDLFDAERRGLFAEAVADLAARLRRTWERFRPCFKTKTRDTGENAWVYLRGVLTMETKRNFVNTTPARTTDEFRPSCTTKGTASPEWR